MNIRLSPEMSATIHALGMHRGIPVDRASETLIAYPSESRCINCGLLVRPVVRVGDIAWVHYNDVAACGSSKTND